MKKWEDIERYVVVTIGALNDTDPASASAASECLLHLIDTRGKEFPQLVQLLVPYVQTEEEQNTKDEIKNTKNEESKTTKSNKSSKSSKQEKEEELIRIEKEKLTRVLRPRCLMDGLYAMNQRERNYGTEKDTETIAGSVLRRHARALLSTLKIEKLKCSKLCHYNRL